MVTQKEIAKMLGVSRSTVARAINGNGPVKEEIKEKILKLIEELNYEKNIVGSSLAMQHKKRVVAFVLESKNAYYTNSAIIGFERIATEYRTMNLEIKIVKNDINDVKGQIDSLKKVLKESDNINGLIIAPLDARKIDKILSKHPEIKVITYDIQISEDIRHIGPDYFKQGRIAADIIANMLLAENDKILIIDNGDDNVSSKKYLEGYISRIKESSLEIIGPIIAGNEEKSIEIIKKYHDEFKGLYINRYAQNILMTIEDKYIKNKKIVLNGMGEEIQDLIFSKKITATVTNDYENDTYMAGKNMFELIYKNITLKGWLKSVNRIIFLENLK